MLLITLLTIPVLLCVLARGLFLLLGGTPRLAAYVENADGKRLSRFCGGVLLALAVLGALLVQAAAAEDLRLGGVAGGLMILLISVSFGLIFGTKLFRAKELPGPQTEAKPASLPEKQPSATVGCGISSPAFLPARGKTPILSPSQAKDERSQNHDIRG